MKITQEQFVKAITHLGLCYGKPFTEEMVAAWFPFFRDCTDSEFRLATTRLIVRSRFLPAISDIRGELAMIRDEELQLDPSEEWGKVMSIVSRHGHVGYVDELHELPAITQRALENIGGYYEVCRSEGDWMRRGFIEAFEGMQNAKKRAAQTLSVQRTVKEAMLSEERRAITG